MDPPIEWSETETAAAIVFLFGLDSEMSSGFPVIAFAWFTIHVDGDESLDTSMMEQNTMQETAQVIDKGKADWWEDAIFPRFLLAAAATPSAVAIFIDSIRFSRDSPTMVPPSPQKVIRVIDSIKSSISIEDGCLTSMISSSSS